MREACPSQLECLHASVARGPTHVQHATFPNLMQLPLCMVLLEANRGWQMAYGHGLSCRVLPLLARQLEPLV